jgi:hypothetical protein
MIYGTISQLGIIMSDVPTLLSYSSSVASLMPNKWVQIYFNVDGREYKQRKELLKKVQNDIIENLVLFTPI